MLRYHSGDTLTQFSFSPGNNKRLELHVKACTNKCKLSLQFCFLLWQSRDCEYTYSGNYRPTCIRHGGIRDLVRKDLSSKRVT